VAVAFVRDPTGPSPGGAKVQCVGNWLRGDLYDGRGDDEGHYTLRLPSAPYGCRAMVGEKLSAFYCTGLGCRGVELTVG